MKKITLYNIYLWIAIIILIVLSSISFYFVVREIISKNYISNDLYISRFYYNYDCDYWYDWRINDELKIKECTDNLKKKLLEKREYRYKFNIIKYWVLLSIVLVLLWVHSFLYIIRKK